MIRLMWEHNGETIRLEVGDNISTADLLELLDAFIRSMGRDPTGDLDYVNDEL